MEGECMVALEGLKAVVGLANPVEVVERACVGPWGPGGSEISSGMFT
jgi:hypothetical protein